MTSTGTFDHVWFVPLLNCRIKDKYCIHNCWFLIGEYFSMDYLTGYPTTKDQHDVILVVVDRFSKMVILIPCKNTMTTHQTTQLFFEHVWKNYGLLMTIIFDRDVRFVSMFWKTLFVDNFTSSDKWHTEVVSCLVVQFLCM